MRRDCVNAAIHLTAAAPLLDALRRGRAGKLGAHHGDCTRRIDLQDPAGVAWHGVNTAIHLAPQGAAPLVCHPVHLRTHEIHLWITNPEDPRSAEGRAVDVAVRAPDGCHVAAPAAEAEVGPYHLHLLSVWRDAQDTCCMVGRTIDVPIGCQCTCCILARATHDRSYQRHMTPSAIDTEYLPTIAWRGVDTAICSQNCGVPLVRPVHWRTN
mmetsp:Transcript_31226/g.67342  ORF Transcript_31226/g.67342 Transcript_31226/m.67342 type:complete len:211 (+) Transcript_31226:510-1142(+)